MKFIIQFILISTLAACASNKLVEKTPEEKKAELYYGHGTQALVDKNYTSALKHLQQAAELDPKDSKVQNNLGMAYYFKEKPSLATTHLKKAIELDKKNSDARINLAGIYYAQGRLDLAFQEYLAVSKDLIYPNQFRTYYNMALILEKQNQTAKAREFIAMSLKENENYCPAYFLEGKMNEKVMQWKDALTSYQNATKGQCYQEPAPHFSQAQVLIKMGRIIEAREKLQMVMEQFSRTPYFSKATQELALLSNFKSKTEEDILKEARFEMQKIRDREAAQPKTYQGTSF